MTLPDYREGDTVQPGRGVAEIVDLSEIEIKAKVNETDRGVARHGRVRRSVSIEARPALPLTGSTKGVGGLAARAFWDAGRRAPVRRVVPPGSQPSRRSVPGMTARVVIAGERLAGVQHLPRQVLFEKEGKPVVYVRDGDGFTPTPGEGGPPHGEPRGRRRASPPTRRWR